MASEVLMTCPLDEAHRILKARMQFHLVRCFKNHTYEKKMRCPWNPLHFVDRCEYLDHCNNKCDNLVNAMGSKILSEDDAGRDVASIPISVVAATGPTTEEDWDADPCPGTYDPLKQLENRPILRGSIGLSKAKKREFKQQERKRHQQMDNILPIQIEPSRKAKLQSGMEDRGEKLRATFSDQFKGRYLSKRREKQAADEMKPARLPHSRPIAMSANTSVVEDANSSQISNEGEKYAKCPIKLRPPHEPSPGMIYEAIDDFGFERTKTDRSHVTLFDTQFEDFQNVDSATCAPSPSSRSANLQALRKLMNASAEAPKRGVTSAKAKDTSKNATTDTQEPARQDEAASLASEGFRNIVDELTQQLADLETAQKSIEEKKAAIFEQILQRSKNNANSESTVVSSVETRGFEFSHKNRQVNRKCAANLGKPVTIKNALFHVIGRGSGLNSEALKNCRAPGTRGNQRNAEEIFEPDSKENVNPFVPKATSAEIANPFKNATGTDIGSTCGYETDE